MSDLYMLSTFIEAAHDQYDTTLVLIITHEEGEFVARLGEVETKYLLIEKRSNTIAEALEMMCAELADRFEEANKE